MKDKDIRPLGLYLHIPFCKAKCAYCDFYSLPHSEEKMDAYVAALCRHLAETAPMAAEHTVDTVYIGGGTPSYLGAARLGTLLSAVKTHYRLAESAEITLEANPDSLPEVRELQVLHRLGVNRVSLGVQSSEDAVLQALGRVHTWQQAAEAAGRVRAAGITALSVDLIYGLPDQTMDQWQKTLNDVLSLKPEHISCYGLKIEEGTALWKRRDTLTLPDDDMQADMYLYTVEMLAQAGYEQYEISNFARPGHASRHNLKYWTLGEYVGFGPGAHSDFGGIRYACARDLEAYLQGEWIISESDTVSAEERKREYVMLSLRTADGICARDFEQRFHQCFSVLERRLQMYEKHTLASRTERGWRLTAEGFLVSNAVIADLLAALDREG